MKYQIIEHMEGRDKFILLKVDGSLEKCWIYYDEATGYQIDREQAIQKAKDRIEDLRQPKTKLIYETN